MKKYALALMTALLLSLCCRGSTEPEVRAVVEIYEFEVLGTPWGTSSYYEIEFEIVERGGVAIIVSEIRCDNYDAQNVNYAYINLDVFETLGSTNRVNASGTRWGQSDFFDIENHSMAKKMKLTIRWNDDLGNTGNTTSIVNVVNLLPVRGSLFYPKTIRRMIPR